MIPLLQKGYSIHGLDLSPNMLERIQNKAKKQNISIPQLYQQDIFQLDVSTEYDVIYYPFNSLAHITGTTSEQATVFSKIHNALTDTGTFAFDIYIMDFELIHDYENIVEHQFTHNGTTYKFETWSTLDSLPEQTFKSKNRIINTATDTIEWETDHTLNLYPKQQLELLLDTA